MGWQVDIPGVDSLTHAFVVILGAPGTLSAPYLFVLVLGAIIPDVDILFKPLSDRYPGLYIFTHGGVTHSIPGALAMTPLALTGIALAGAAGAFPGSGPDVSWILMGLFFAAGTFTHLLLDALAYPGIPLLYPFSPRKYTLGIFPGPSLVLFVASIIVAAVTLTGHGGPAVNQVYAAFGILFILSSAGIALFAQSRTPGRAIPTLNPFRWLILTEDHARYVVSFFSLRSGSGPEKIFPKYTNTTPRELETMVRGPEYQRLMFYSYAVTATRDGDQVVFADPLRTEGIIFYPPYYTRLLLPVRE